MKLSKKVRRMLNIQKDFQEYVRTYPVDGALADKTFILDMLYGMGISLDSKYQFARGFREFKKALLKQLQDDPDIKAEGGQP